MYIKPEYQHLVEEAHKLPSPQQPAWRGIYPAKERPRVPLSPPIPEGSPEWEYRDNSDLGTLSQREYLTRDTGDLDTKLKLARDADVYIVSLIAKQAGLHPELRELLKQHPVQQIRNLAWSVGSDW